MNAGLSEADLQALAILSRGFWDREDKMEVEGVVPMLWGPPGTGKSERTEEIAALLGRDVVQIDMATAIPEDVGGLAARSTIAGFENVFTKLCWDELAEAAEEGKILFFDDFTAANGITQKSVLRLVQKRRFGKFKMTRTPIIMGGNIDPGSATATMPPAVANRLFHMEISPDKDVYEFSQTGMSQLHLDVARAHALIWDDKRWRPLRQTNLALKAKFIEENRNFFDQPPGDDQLNVALNHAYATYRSLDMFTSLYTSAQLITQENILDMRDIDDLVIGSIGKAKGALMTRFLDGRHVPTYAEILSGKVDWAKTTASDITVALSGAARQVETDKEVVAFLDAVESMGQVKGDAADLAGLAIRIVIARATTAGNVQGKLAMNLAPKIKERAQGFKQRYHIGEDEID